MMNQSSQSCRLGFLNSWSVENHLWGVTGGASGLELDRKLFSCCQGDGIIVESLKEKDARLCGLTRRWNMLVNVFNQSGLTIERGPEFWRQVSLRRTLGDKAAGQPGDRSAVDHEIRSFVAQYIEELLNCDKGRIFSWSSPALGSSAIRPYLVPMLAAILAWHHERVVLTGKPGEASLPVSLWQDLLLKNKSSKHLMILEAAPDLWNASKLEPLEAAIAFAYERKMPIWIHYGSTENGSALSAFESESQRKSRSFRQAVNSRLEGLRKKSPFEWLSAQSKSRLLEICVVAAPAPDNTAIPEFI